MCFGAVRHTFVFSHMVSFSAAVKGLGGPSASNRCTDGGLLVLLAEEGMSVNTTERPSGQSSTLESASHLVVRLGHRASAQVLLTLRHPGERSAAFPTWLILINMSSDCLRLSNDVLITFLWFSSSSLFSSSNSPSSCSSSVSVLLYVRPLSSVIPRSPPTSEEPLFTDRSRGLSLLRPVRSSACWMWESSLRILLRCSHRCLWAGRSSFSRWEILRSAAWYSCKALERSVRRAATDSEAPSPVASGADWWLVGPPQADRDDVSLLGLVTRSLHHSSLGRA